VQPKTILRPRQALILRQAQDATLRYSRWLQSSVLALLMAVVLLATSCAGPATQPSPEPGTTPTASLADTVAEASWPVPQFSPGQHLRFDTISLEQGLSHLYRLQARPGKPQ
jgi:hypothetical protein